MSEGATVALILLMFPVAFFLIWSLVGVVVHFISGWNRLLHHYPAGETRHLQWRKFRSGRVGYGGWKSARFAHVLEIAVDRDAVYLRPFLPFRLTMKTLRIPFAEGEARTEKVMFFDAYVIHTRSVPAIQIALTPRDGRWIEEQAQRG